MKPGTGAWWGLGGASLIFWIGSILILGFSRGTMAFIIGGIVPLVWTAVFVKVWMNQRERRANNEEE